VIEKVGGKSKKEEESTVHLRGGNGQKKKCLIEGCLGEGYKGVYIKKGNEQDRKCFP